VDNILFLWPVEIFCINVPFKLVVMSNLYDLVKQYCLRWDCNMEKNVKEVGWEGFCCMELIFSTAIFVSYL